MHSALPDYPGYWLTLHFFFAYPPVARIAYLSSDVIVSVQPSLAAESDFSSHLKRYASRKDRGVVASSVDAIPVVSFAITA